MSADKRSVHTDALATLGTIIDDTAGRDAIHLAVEPVVAGAYLKPGQDIGIRDGKAYGPGNGVKLIGIVDPFLKDFVQEGQMFWLIVYPRQITSLRHVWSHPDFGDEITPEQKLKAKEVTERLTNAGLWKAREWIKNFAENDLGMTVEELMKAADRWIESGDYTYDNSEAYKEHWGKFEEFWDHYETITGRHPDERESFFTCSC